MKPIAATKTRFPALTKAVLAHLDREQLADVARYGAAAGWSGFTYYTETDAFFNKHRADIIALAKQTADDFGQGMFAMIKAFRCLNGSYSEEEIAEAIYANTGDAETQVKNALAWFALEEVSRELNPDL